MPFDSDGNYIPTPGAETAVAGDVIRSATWNTINVDYAEALTQLAKGQFTPTPRSVSGSFVVAPSDTTILVTGSAPTITMPSCASKLGAVTIMGAAAGVFGSFNSIVLFQGAETASGVGTITLSNNYQVATFYPLASGGYIIR